jgi:hypothetical protein
MGEARHHVALPRFPSARYRTRRIIPDLGTEIRSATFVHKVQYRHCRIARLGKTTANLDVTA